jgi:heat shock protein HslJ
MRRLSSLVVVAAVLLALVACSTEPSPSASNPVGRPVGLIGTAWRVVSVAGRDPNPGAVPTAMFSADRVTGSGGCNTYGGRYRYDPTTGQIEMRDLGMTLMACAEAPRNDFETVFFQTLGQVNLATVDLTGRLTLSGPAGVIVLEVDPQRAVEG